MTGADKLFPAYCCVQLPALSLARLTRGPGDVEGILSFSDKWLKFLHSLWNRILF